MSDNNQQYVDHIDKHTFVKPFEIWSKEYILQFTVFNGLVQLCELDKRKDSSKFLVSKKTLSDFACKTLKDSIKKILKSSPGTKESLVVSKRDENGKYQRQYVIILIKDDKMVYHMELQEKGASDYGKYTFYGTKAISNGADTMTPATSSQSELERLYEWFDREVPIMKIMTIKKYQKPTKGSNSNNKPSPSHSDNSSDDDFFS